MEFNEAIIYIVGIGLTGALVGVILGVILGAEQIIRLRDSNELLKAQLDAAKKVKPEIIEINVPEAQPVKNYFEKF